MPAVFRKEGVRVEGKRMRRCAVSVWKRMSLMFCLICLLVSCSFVRIIFSYHWIRSSSDGATSCSVPAIISDLMTLTRFKKAASNDNPR